MDHQQATDDMAAEKYLLNELTPEARDAFEQHFFDCQECAIELRVTAGFIDAARKEFRNHPVPKPGEAPKSKSYWAPRWLALAACLLVIAYQNAVVFPHFKTQIAALQQPEMLPSFSLVGGNSRGGETHPLSVGHAKPFLLQFDIPTEDRFLSYNCLLYGPGDSLLWQKEVPGQLAKDTISIRVPPTNRASGRYKLVIQGKVDHGGPGTAVEVADLPFTLNTLE